MLCVLNLLAGRLLLLVHTQAHMTQTSKSELQLAPARIASEVQSSVVAADVMLKGSSKLRLVPHCCMLCLLGQASACFDSLDERLDGSAN